MENEVIINKREVAIIRMALSYLLSNLDDAIDAFGTGPSFNNHPMRCKVHLRDRPVIIDSPTEDEIQSLLDG